jgi:lysine decarboxylase
MDADGRKRLKDIAREIEKLKRVVAQKSALRFVDEGVLNRPQDVTRIVVDFLPLGIGGYEAEKILAEEFRIYAEMADNRYVVFIPSAVTKKREIEKLGKALCKIEKRKDKNNEVQKNMRLPEIDIQIAPDKAIDKEFEVVDIKDALGHISAGVVSACPPGAAVLVPGQYIDEDAAGFLVKNKVAEKVEVIVG